MHEITPFIRLGGVVVEVGSRDGHDAAKMASIVGASRTVVVEAHPVCYNRIVASYPEFEVYNFAIGSQTGPVDFYMVDPNLPSETVGQSSLLYRPLYDMVARRVTVPGLTMDDFVEQVGLDEIEVMKIDIEGATADLLDGFSKIRMTRVFHIESELQEFWPGQRLYGYTREVMTEAGYREVDNVPVFTAQSDSIWVRED